MHFSSLRNKITILILGLLLSVPGFVSAQSLSERIMGQVNAGATSAALSRTVASPQAFAAQAIQVFLGLLATIFLILILMSGFWLITARGEEEKYEKALYTIKRAVIGFIIVMAAYAITTLIMRTVLSSVGLVDEQIHCVPDPTKGIRDVTFCARQTDQYSCETATTVGSNDTECVWVSSGAPQARTCCTYRDGGSSCTPGTPTCIDTYTAQIVPDAASCTAICSGNAFRTECNSTIVYAESQCN